MMRDRIQDTGTAVTLSAVAFLLFLERVFMDFRYVSLEMEATRDIMPFTAPYMAFAFVIFGLWMWALLAAIQKKRRALIGLLVFNLPYAALWHQHPCCILPNTLPDWRADC